MAELWHPVVMEKGLSYPSMTDCMVVGISGGCGNTCPVYMAGRCEEPEGIEPAPEQIPGITKEGA